jgi:hypothetical protein
LAKIKVVEFTKRLYTKESIEKEITMVDENTQAPEENANTETAPEVAPEVGQEEAPADLNLNDLNALRSIIDVASTRGAFKAGEMAAVGTIYNKLDSFLNQAAKAQANA